MAEGTIRGTALADLPASSYAYCEPGTGAPSQRCHFPIRDSAGKLDAAHVRNALARLAQSPFGPKARAKVEAAARQLGIGEAAQKSSFDMKAEAFTGKKLDRWLTGEISRRVLVIPFSGPLPGCKAGLDLDGEYFDAESDLYGPFPGLRASRWRAMDWHHDDAGVPAPLARMKGSIIGEVELDGEPEDDGLWADWWIKQGRARKDLIAARRVALLEQMGQPLYGSSQAVFKQKADDGHIEVWPIYRHTATTSPQNTHAVIPALKGLLDDLTPDDLTSGAMTALLVGLSELVPDLSVTFSSEAADPFPGESGEPEAKAGRVLAKSKEQRLRDAITSLFD